MPVFQKIIRLAPLALLLALPAFAADPITGVVTNKTTNKPSAGDEVVLIRLAAGMQETTRATTDARGRFTLAVPDDGVHLVRVTHDKAAYFHEAPPGTQSIEMSVYNASAHVKGVTAEADVLRIQTEPGDKSLKVIENFFVKNDSTPPMTQFSDRPFEFVLPDGAVIAGSAALSQGSMPVQSPPVPLAEKNHYTFLFPVRPGETRFQVTYSLPYNGTLKFSPQETMPTDTIAIMMPKSMGFKADPQVTYTPITEEVNAQTYIARSVNPGQPLSFTLTGGGQLPRETTATDQGQDAQGGAAGASPADANASAGVGASGKPDTTKFGGGMGKPLDPDASNDPWSKYKWWILGGLAVLMAIAAGVLLRRPTPGVAQAPAPAPVNPKPSIQEALKEELFALETDRLQGKITEEEYAAHKNALNLTLMRSLNRSEKQASQ